jgi:hypothetical protein
VESWVAPLRPDEVHPDWMYGQPLAAPSIGKGMKVFTVWWD